MRAELMALSCAANYAYTYEKRYNMNTIEFW